MTQALRPAAVAGLFYPAEAEALRRELARHLLDAGVADHGLRAMPKMLLVPHAGYRYSGVVAAGAYAALAPWRGRIERVVLLGPTHRVAVRAIALPAAQAFATPLGQLPLDRPALAALAGLPQVVVSDAAHAEEHALEVQLPFLQHVLGGFALVPLAVGQVEPDAVAEVIERLWGGAETLFVISSDLSHYLAYDAARARDRATIEKVLALDADLAHGEACGATPLAGALIAARRHSLSARLVDLRNSGDTAGDRRRVVGYASVIFEERAADSLPARDVDEVARKAAGTPAAPAAAGSLVVGTAEAAATSAAPRHRLGPALIAHARDAIALELGLAGPAAAPPLDHPALGKPGASFVTLHHRGALRGCVGALEPYRPLVEDVRSHAVAAAFADRRFAPLAAHEFSELEIEVSVLGATEPMAVASEAEACLALRPGVDGVILLWRGRRATFLPQVWESLPDPQAFLAALKRKAALPADFWAEDLMLWRYGVAKFAIAPAEAAAEEEWY